MVKIIIAFILAAYLISFLSGLFSGEGGPIATR